MASDEKLGRLMSRAGLMVRDWSALSPDGRPACRLNVAGPRGWIELVAPDRTEAYALAMAEIHHLIERWDAPAGPDPWPKSPLWPAGKGGLLHRIEAIGPAVLTIEFST